MPARLLTILTMLVAFMLPAMGFASSNEVIGDSLCNVVGWMAGKTGHAIVILAMVITGVMALMNKISWNIALVHLAGEALVLKAVDMVSAIASGGANC